MNENQGAHLYSLENWKINLDPIIHENSVEQ